ncbi:ABC transporter substrate-binding protein [Chlorogloeopsis sp. ULAP02]|uniref:ABC transporter substrate-binding protein n=1 Tax=Chlorogloeopsis sp. ULAP02 TaxID=3107926 RepID=UPI00313676D6
MANSIRIGVHVHNLSVFTLSKKPELLEDLLQPTGVSAEWISETGGKQTVKLLKTAEIDIGATGTTPPILAQAKGVPVVYLATSQPRPVHGAIAVLENSPIQSVSDFKDKTVSLSEGSYQQHILAIALEKAGLTYQDVKTIPHTADSLKAFLNGEIDVWITSDLNLAEVQKTHPVRVLLYSSELFSNRSIYFTHRAFAEEHPDALSAFIRALERVDRWIATHFSEAAELLAREINNGIDAQGWEKSLRNRPWGLVPPSEEFIAEQQYAADVFYRFGLLPNSISVSKALLTDPLSVFEANLALAGK